MGGQKAKFTAVAGTHNFPEGIVQRCHGQRKCENCAIANV